MTLVALIVFVVVGVGVTISLGIIVWCRVQWWNRYADILSDESLSEAERQERVAEHESRQPY